MVEILTKRERKLYFALKELFEKHGAIQFSLEEFVPYRSLVEKLAEVDAVIPVYADHYVFLKKGEAFDYFLVEEKEARKEERKLSRRELRIAIVSAVIGAAIGLIPYIVSLFQKVG